MTIPTNSGIIALSDGVRSFFQTPPILAFFQKNGVTIPVVGTTGWRQREQNLNAATAPLVPGQSNRRVLFIPGTEGGDEGEFTEPRHRSGVGIHQTNTVPRVLATWNRIVTASIWAVDTSDRNDEQLQIAASDNLLEMTVQALTWFATADFVAGSGKIRRPQPATANLPFGREVLYQFVHREPIYDLPRVVVPGGVPTVVKSPAS